MTVWLELEHVKEICFELAVVLPFKEPIPSFGTRFPGKLESCLAAPRHWFNGAFLYPTLVDQAAILFYVLNKDHPFANGNKRIALTSLMVFLALNHRWISVDIMKFYEFSVSVAASDAREKDRVTEYIKDFIVAHAQRYRDPGT